MAGLKASDEIESSGGEVTSKSFIGFADDGVEVVPKEEEVPNVLWLNIIIRTYLKCNKGYVNLPNSESVNQQHLAGFAMYEKKIRITSVRKYYPQPFRSLKQCWILTLNQNVV